MDATGHNDLVKLMHSKQEALVLFDWLGKFNSVERDNLFAHGAEQQVLFDLEASLEKILVEPFSENYSDLIKNARESVFPSNST